MLRLTSSWGRDDLQTPQRANETCEIKCSDGQSCVFLNLNPRSGVHPRYVNSQMDASSLEYETGAVLTFWDLAAMGCTGQNAPREKAQWVHRPQKNSLIQPLKWTKILWPLFYLGPVGLWLLF